MSDTPDLIRLYTDAKYAKMRYEEALKNADSQDIAEIKAYMETFAGFREGVDYSDKVYRMEYKKAVDFWIPLPKRKLADSSRLLYNAISELDKLGEL